MNPRHIPAAVLGFVLGAAVMLGGSAVAGDDQVDQRQTSCHPWADEKVEQCNVYYTGVRHARTNVYIDGEVLLTVDVWPNGQARLIRR